MQELGFALPPKNTSDNRQDGDALDKRMHESKEQISDKTKSDSVQDILNETGIGSNPRSQRGNAIARGLKETTGERKIDRNKGQDCTTEKGKVCQQEEWNNLDRVGISTKRS
jgi:hypothetical protein